MYLNTHKKKWDEFHSLGYTKLKYPSEHVVRFIRSNFKNEKENKHIFDLGFGSGRHIMFLLTEGYKVSGMDLSTESVAYTKHMVDEHGYRATISEGSITHIPFENESFDGLICHGVLLYLKLEDIKLAISEIYRVLKVGGKALIIVRSTKDMRYAKGMEIEKNTFLLSDNFTNEQDMIMHFFEEEELYDLLKDFGAVSIGISEFSMSSTTEFNSDYIINITK